MYDHETRLLEILTACEYDRGRLSVADDAEARRLAGRDGIELWHPGARWPSSPSVALSGGKITPA